MTQWHKVAIPVNQKFHDQLNRKSAPDGRTNYMYSQQMEQFVYIFNKKSIDKLPAVIFLITKK